MSRKHYFSSAFSLKCSKLTSMWGNRPLIINYIQACTTCELNQRFWLDKAGFPHPFLLNSWAPSSSANFIVDGKVQVYMYTPVMCESGHLESESGSESSRLESESTRIRIHHIFLESESESNCFESESGFESDIFNVTKWYNGTLNSESKSRSKQIWSWIQIRCISNVSKSEYDWYVFELRWNVICTPLVF